MDESQCRAFLAKHGISVQEWGKGGAKTLNHLIAELSATEAELSARDGLVVRRIRIARVSVCYIVGGKKLLLREQKQVFKDGRERIRRHLGSSISEKIRKGENPEEVARRAIQEELGINEYLRLSSNGIIYVPLSPSRSFPGLLTENSIYVFCVHLLEKHYNPNGYIEEQHDKSTYFVWEDFPSLPQ